MEECFKDLLRVSRTNRTLVAVHIERIFEGEFEVGVILALNQRGYVLARMSTEGLPNGVVVGRLRDISRVDTNTRYLRALALLADTKGEWQPWLEGVFACEPSRVGAKTLIHRELLRAKTNEEIATVSGALTEIGLTGFVREVRDDYLDLLVITDEGEEQGHSRVRIKLIERVIRGDRSGEDLRILYLNRRALYQSPDNAGPGKC